MSDVIGSSPPVTLKKDKLLQTIHGWIGYLGCLKENNMKNKRKPYDRSSKEASRWWVCHFLICLVRLQSTSLSKMYLPYYIITETAPHPWSRVLDFHRISSRGQRCALFHKKSPFIRIQKHPPVPFSNGCSQTHFQIFMSLAARDKPRQLSRRRSAPPLNLLTPLRNFQIW